MIGRGWMEVSRTEESPETDPWASLAFDRKSGRGGVMPTNGVRTAGHPHAT